MTRRFPGPRIRLRPGTKQPAQKFVDRPGLAVPDWDPRGRPFGQRLDGVTVFDVERGSYSGTDVDWRRMIDGLISECAFVVRCRDDDSSWHFYFAGVARSRTGVNRDGVNSVKSGDRAFVVGAGSSGVFDGVPKIYRVERDDGPLTSPVRMQRHCLPPQPTATAATGSHAGGGLAGRRAERRRVTEIPRMQQRSPLTAVERAVMADWLAAGGDPTDEIVMIDWTAAA